MAPSSSLHIYDVIGCGFGPANLAIAAALTDRWSDCQPGEDQALRDVLFIEKHATFLWHPGMLLPGSKMQISCLKDLATLRRPTSPLTFLSYLHSQKRLVSFINRASTIPTRREFADYLAWAAREVETRGVCVAYGEQVLALSKIDSGHGAMDIIEVVSQRVGDQVIVRRRTKHLILSAGGSPRIPSALSSLCVLPHAQRPTIIHTSSYISSIGPFIDGLSPTSSHKIAVIGAGQSAAEVLLDLHNRLASISSLHGSRQYELHMIIRKGSLKPSDDSPFVNEIFDPESTDTTYTLPTYRARKIVSSEYKNTNYGVVNPQTLEALYELMYDQKLDDCIAADSPSQSPTTKPRIKLCAYQTMISARTTTSLDGEIPSVTVTLQNTLTRDLSEVTYDAVICGTGYERLSWMRLLRSSNLARHFGLRSSDVQEAEALITLLPENAGHDEQIRFDFADDCNAEGRRSISSSTTLSTSNSSPSTPPTSPGFSDSTSFDMTVRISRNYRLLPRVSAGGDAVEEFKPRIYLQGYAETTHGLSDTLLSVLGVRAGEVVDDLWQSEQGYVR